LERNLIRYLLRLYHNPRINQSYAYKWFNSILGEPAHRHCPNAIAPEVTEFLEGALLRLQKLRNVEHNDHRAAYPHLLVSIEDV
jgi:hypothetical protein